MALGAALPILVVTPLISINLPILVIAFIIVVTATSSLLFCVGGFSEVHQESRLSFENISRRISKLRIRKERKWAERFVKSCGLIKIKFGGNNFVEELTPLNCLSHATQLAVQILLYTRSH